MRTARIMWDAGWTVLFLTGVPVGLVRLTGLPGRGALPDRQALIAWIEEPLTPGFVTGCVTLAAWLLWALVMAVAIIRVTTALTWRRRWLTRLRIPAPMQGLTAALLGAAAVSSATPALAHTAPVAVTDTHPDQRTPDHQPSTPTTRATSTAPEQAATTGQSATTWQPERVTVRRGDTLWNIADTRLDDPTRWPEIYHLNADQYRMRGGHHLRPGWILTLPTPPQVPDTPPRQQPAPDSPEDQAPPAADGYEDGAASPDEPPTSSPTAQNTPADGHNGSADDRTAPNPPGVSLPGGGWVDIGLAAAVVAAAALVWAHRRRRYTPRPPSADLRLNDPDLAPMPPVVRNIRRGLRGQATTPDANTSKAATSGNENDTRREPPPADTAAPAVPALTNPLAVTWPPAGLGLAGPGSDAAARGFLAAGLAAGGLDDPDARTWVVMPSTTAATLLGTAVVLPDTPRLTVTTGLEEALELLEAQTLHRSRLVDRHDVDDVAALRAADPFTEPLPPIMLLADTSTRDQGARVAALLTQGRRLDIHGVLLGEWLDGDTILVAADGTTSPAERDPARHSGHPADIGRLAVLDPTETIDLLRPLAESHTGQPQTPTPAETAPTEATETKVEPQPADNVVANELDEPRHLAAQPPTDAFEGPTDAAITAAQEQAASEPAAEPATVSADAAQQSRPAPAVIDDAPAADARTAPPVDTGGDVTEPARPPGRVEVAVLGQAEIVNADPQRTLRKKSLELLVYLAVHDGAVAAEAILDDLLPDAPSSKAVHRLHTYISDLRAVLRHNNGPGTYITHPDHRYHLNHTMIDIDLWRMRAATRDADAALTPHTRLDALRRAFDAYTGPIADGHDYEWIEPYREAARGQALDAALALTEALADQPHEQITVLETAIGHDPYAEDLYQAAMRAHAQLGHLDAIRALRRTLTRRLAEIDAEPSDETIALADRLVTDLRRPGSRTRPEPRDGAAA